MPSRISITEAFKSHPVDIHHKHTDFSSLQELPDSYAWTHHQPPAAAAEEEDHHPEAPPVIDLSDPNALSLIGHASKTWGVFQVTNHGVSAALLRDVETAGRRLFSLPVQQKMKAARSPDGVTGYGLARISSFFSKLMWSEGFTILGSPLDHFRKLWPQDYTKYCEIIEEYEAEVKKLAGRLMWLMLGSLGITVSDLKWAGPKGDFKDSNGALQLNSYPVCPDPDRAMGLAPHTDSTLLTILHQTNTSGLQVTRDGSRWVMVPPVRGALVVNVGDLLHILSNGLYPSVMHRAVVNRSRYRLSVAYLYGPPPNVQISPLQRLVGPGRPQLYRSVTWNEYLGTKAKHFNKALYCLRVLSPVNGSPDLNDHSLVKVN